MSAAATDVATPRALQQITRSLCHTVAKEERVAYLPLRYCGCCCSSGSAANEEREAQEAAAAPLTDGLPLTRQSTLHHKSVITNKRATCTYEFTGHASRILLQLGWTIVTAMRKRTAIGTLTTGLTDGRRRRQPGIDRMCIRCCFDSRSACAAPPQLRQCAKERRLSALHRRSSFLSAVRPSI